MDRSKRTPALASASSLGSLAFLAVPLALAVCGCPSGGSDDDDGLVKSKTAETCMTCHNGSHFDDYAGKGLENPHPFGGAGTIKCTTCHGGDPNATKAAKAHVPPPPEIGDEEFQEENALAYFNRLTLAGIDKFADYVVKGKTFTALDYLQFLNPGDMRVVALGRGCGGCHDTHAADGMKSLLFNEVGVVGGARFTSGDENAVPQSQDLYEDTAGDYGFRAVFDASFGGPTTTGAVEELVESPVYTVFGATPSAQNAFENRNEYLAANLNTQVTADNRVQPGSALSNLFHEQIVFTCGDCHLGSAGANNRYADFRSSGCAACHMPYSRDGRYTGTDKRIEKQEPLDPDAITAPERAHVEKHLLVNVAKTLQNGDTVQGISDYACVDCHQGSNRTVIQYWGIRLDQNADLVNRVQYPANPETFRTTAEDTRLYDPLVGNQTFNGRNPNQYILAEDYDGDGRDDTPADVHYDAGLGCIDCHGSAELHGGRQGLPDNPILTHMEQAVGIQCVSCHGTIAAYAPTAPGTAFDGTQRDLALDRKGNPVTNVYLDTDGELYLISKLTGKRHYVPQTRDTVSDNGKVNPLSGEVIYNEKASYAMGRIDADPTNGLGPVQQAAPTTQGFSHSDNLDCVACHASWTNTCTGCHLKGDYNTGNNFSNITGDRIVYRQTNADFTYQSPVPFQLGVNTHNKIAPITTNTNVFYQYRDIEGVFTRVFAWTDRNGTGNTQQPGGGAYPALAHNLIMPHSIRGRVTADNEGPRYCVACHLTEGGLQTFGAAYDAFRTAMATNDFQSLDFQLLQEHIGKNPSNQLDSPLWVHQAAGLGSGLFLFNENGCPVNPLDNDDDRKGCEVIVDNGNGQALVPGPAPAVTFDPATFIGFIRYNLDRIVEPTGVSNSSNNHSLLEPIAGGSPLRDGALDPELAGPLGATLIRRLTDPDSPDGIVLDSWIDADGTLRGAAPQVLGPGP